MENDFDKRNEIPEGSEPKPPEEQPPTDDTVIVPAIGAERRERPEAAPTGDGGGESAENESVESRGRKLLERLDSMLYNPEKHSGDEDGIPDDDDAPLTERDFKPIRKRRDGKIGCLGGLMYFVFCVSLSVVLACLAWMAAVDVLALNKDPIERTITLPEEIFEYTEETVENEDGSTETRTVSRADIDYVANTLKEAGLIEYKWLFKLFCSFSDAELEVDPGTYTLTTSLDYNALVSNMQTGTASMATTTITFPEGFTMQEIFERLEENGICSVEEPVRRSGEFFLQLLVPGLGRGGRRLEA